MERTADLKRKYLDKQRDLTGIKIDPLFPKIVKIDICNVCNYSCVFCPQAKQTNKKIGCIEKELCKKIIKEAYESGASELCLSMTGEPLINPELEEYISYSKQLGYEYVFMNTNGYLLDEKRAQHILRAGIDSVKVSVNASAKSYALIHGIDAFDRIVENIKQFDFLRKKNNCECKLFISFVAVKQTIDEFDELKDLLGNFVDDMIIMNANHRGGSVSEIEECLYAGEDEYSFQYPCSQLFQNVYITAEGYMVICCQDFENLTVVADLHKESVVQAWTNPYFTEFRKRYLNHDLKGTLCQNCIYNTTEEIVPLTPEAAYYARSIQKEAQMLDRIQRLVGRKEDG